MNSTYLHNDLMLEFRERVWCQLVCVWEPFCQGCHTMSHSREQLVCVWEPFCQGCHTMSHSRQRVWCQSGRLQWVPLAWEISTACSKVMFLLVCVGINMYVFCFVFSSVEIFPMQSQGHWFCAGQ